LNLAATECLGELWVAQGRTKEANELLTAAYNNKPKGGDTARMRAVTGLLNTWT
jgi:hypothetical protein